jgi:hypothetical protein
MQERWGGTYEDHVRSGTAVAVKGATAYDILYSQRYLTFIIIIMNVHRYRTTWSCPVETQF